MEEISRAQKLLEQVEKLETDNPALVKVCKKLSRKIKADTLFLQRHKDPTSDDNDICLSSSNLPYLSGVLDVVKNSSGVTEIMCDLKTYGITIDVVSDNGRTWKKVVARNPQTIHLIWAGKGQYGNKDIVKKARKYVDGAKRFCEFSPPSVVFVFSNGVTHGVAKALESIEIQVEGDRVEVSQEILERLSGIYVDDSEDSDDEDLFEQAHRKLLSQVTNKQINTDADEILSLTEKVREMATAGKIFLDITTMIAYICDVCHGGSYFQFKEKVLADQAEQERKGSAVDKINSYIEGKTLVTCQSAVDSLMSTTDLLAGPDEKARCNQLLQRVLVVPDNVSPKFAKLVESGQIRLRSKVIFGTADTLRCDIVTSNEGFIRAAAGQGIHISAFLHESRALSEKKRLAGESEILDLGLDGTLS